MNIKSLILLAVILGINVANATRFEIFQTVPVETNLAIAGLRSTQDVWLELIQSAKQSIYLEQFYISNSDNNQNDPSLTKVLNALIAAAKSGVQVQIIVDNSFYKNYPADVNSLATNANIHVRIIDLSKTGGIQHAKFFLVDGKLATVGSANFDWRALTHIHEINFLTDDRGYVTKLSNIFASDWGISSPMAGAASTDSGVIPTVPEEQGSNQIQLVASPMVIAPKTDSTIEALFSKIQSAKKSIQIQTYEYSVKNYNSSERWTALSDNLKAAANRGVKVQLLVDQSKVDKNRADLLDLARTPNIEVRGVQVPQWSGGSIPYARLIHSKYMVFDNGASAEKSAWIGTENDQKNYFYASRNVGAIFSIPEAVDQLEQVFQTVWNSPYSRAVN